MFLLDIPDSEFHNEHERIFFPKKYSPSFMVTLINTLERQITNIKN